MPEDFKTDNVVEAQPKRIAIEYQYSFAKGFDFLFCLYHGARLILFHLSGSDSDAGCHVDFCTCTMRRKYRRDTMKLVHKFTIE